MRRSIALTALLLLALAACGGGEETTSTSARGGSPTPTGATATPEATEGAEEDTPAPADPGTTGDGAGDAGDSGDVGETGEDPPPPPEAPEGEVNRPKTGKYVYDLEGTRKNPFCPAGCEYPDDATRTTEISADGDVYTAKATNSEEAGSTTSRARWESNRVLLLFTKIEGPVQFSCTFEPPVEILHMPVKAETFPAQPWSSDDCEGTTKITVVAEEDVQDANGKTWPTWKIEQETDYRFEGDQGTASGKTRSTTWLSPDLGTAVKSHERNDGEFAGQTGTRSPIDSDTTTTLKRHP